MVRRCWICRISTILCRKIGIKAKKDDKTTGWKGHTLGKFASADIVSASASGKYTIFKKDTDEKENSPIDITNFLT